MDQGSYSRPDGRGQPTLSASSAGNNSYQVNVSRQKTKKWVEAKSQNYDGDDWGADEYTDDEIEPPMPLSPRTPQYGAHQNTPHVPSLHIQTNPPSQLPQHHQPYPPPQSRLPPPANEQPRQESYTPSLAQPTSAVPQSAGGFQPQGASSTYPLSPRSPPDSIPSTTPQSASVNKPLPFVRPSDIYRRMEDEKSRGSMDSSRPSAEIASNLSKQSSVSLAKPMAEPVKYQPPSAPMPAPRTDSRNVIYQDLTMPAGRTSQQQPPAASLPRSEAPPPHAAPELNDEEIKRLSTSPKLPDLARMSVFGADFFSGGFSMLSSEKMAAQRIPEVPEVAPELKVDKPTTHEVSHSPAEAPNTFADKTKAAAVAPAIMEHASIKPQVIESAVHQPPAGATTMTESRGPALPPAEPKPSDPAERATRRSSIDTASSSHSAGAATDITPTKPLNVRKDESPVRSFEPPPPLHREPTFGTDTSSPVKESDMLRDEIIKTLSSPTQASRPSVETGLVDGGTQASQSHARESTYTLQDYDSYWADPGTAPEAASQPPKTMSSMPGEATRAAAGTRSHDLPLKVMEPLKSTEEEKPETSSPTPLVVATQPSPQVPTSQPSTVPAALSGPHSTSPQQLPEASIVSHGGTDLRRRFSWEAEDASKRPPKAAAPTATAPPPEPTPAPAPALAVTAVPPSEPLRQPDLTDRQSNAPPVSAAIIPAVVGSDSTSQGSNRLSLAGEGALSTTASNEISAPVDEQLAMRLSDPTPASALSMPRNSSASVTPFKDIVNLNNSSERVAKFNETRVAFAIMDIGLDKWLTSLHQDHPEHHSKSFNSYQPSPTSPTGLPPGVQSTAQQPYYQQYLNASTPGSGATSGRRIGGITVPSNVGGSTFGHSGNQLGTKSKELMHSAGKMGKGLFSKGKNKLRGDKGDTHPPQQTRAKHDRSGSWAVLSSKLRTEFSSSREHDDPRQQPREEQSAAPRPSMTIAPQIPVPEPVSPLLRETSPDKSLLPAQHSAQQYVRGDQFAAHGTSEAPPLASFVPPASQIRMVPSETAQDPAATEAPARAPPVTEDSGVGMFARPDDSSDEPKRQSSFVGLPPLRRSSTFGLKSKTRRAAERFPLDEDEGNDVPGLPISDVMEDLPEQPEAPQQSRREHTGAAQAEFSSQTVNKDGVTVQHLTSSAEQSPDRSARQPVMASSQPQPMHQPVPPLMMMYPGQSGPWRLEESHLAEPLHQAKNRSGHSPISPSMSFGFDKETGQSAMMPPPPLPASVARQRNADVPPSSAQRYPGLFAPQHEDEPPQRPTSQIYYEEMANPRHSGFEYSIPGVGPPTEERGRVKRNSGLFKEIGDKIVRATSRDRRNSFVENQRQADVHGDGASESSFGTEEIPDRKKRRSSFFNALTGRASMDQGSQHGLSALQRSRTENLPVSSSEDLGSARKRSVFGGVMAGFGANKGGASDAPTSGLANQQVLDDEQPLTPKKKRFSGIAKAFQRPNQDRPSSGISTGSEHNRRASFSNLLSSLTGNKGQQHEQQQPAVPAQDVGGFVSTDLPQNIPPAPRQVHAADDFPAPNRDAALAPTLPDQRLDATQPLFATGENKWGIDRPPTSGTVTANETRAETAGATAGSHLLLRTADSSTPREAPTAPSEFSDSETEFNENARKPSDVTLSIASVGGEETSDMLRRDTNVSQITPSVVTDVPSQDEQQKTPTAQYPNSPGGYLVHNNRLPVAVPPSAGSRGYPQGQLPQPQQDPRAGLTGSSYRQGMGQSAPGTLYGQQPMQRPSQQQQHIQPGFSQPAPRSSPVSASPKGWKGLRTKMAGQMGSMRPLSPTSKGPNRGDKAAPSDMLFNAFRRLSKPQGPSEAQRQRSMPPGSAPPGRQPPDSQVFTRQQGQPNVTGFQQIPPQQMQYQQVPLGQGAHFNRGPYQHLMPMYMQPQQHLQQQQPEHQYAPQGYTSTYGHGSVQVPAMYNTATQYSQPQSPHPQQDDDANHYQPSAAAVGNQQLQSNGAAPTQAHSQLPQSESQPQTPLPQHRHDTESNPLSPASDEFRTKPTALTKEALAQQDARKDLQANHLRPDEAHMGLESSNSNRVSQISNDSRRRGPSPKSEQSPVISHKQLQAATTSPASPGTERHVSAVSVSPLAGSSAEIVSPRSAMASIEVTSPAAAPLARDLTGESKGQVSDDSLEETTKLDKNAAAAAVTTATEHVVELEDTAEARQRTLRIDAQEEKIAYDPEEENPKMNATSYPGQEWNPYGEPGFGDWHE
ncbi:hypothetical protein CCM_06557 [Cordyceps militaris CM01]|uniref:SWI-SNF chromatin-remodeling complex protein n=1 Tax=Cordyceps militaris (strain CM01) TaxID=983644 RepID=G3JMV6_CORMM|nr:uncharacterized protein CCM_06557 [Cordyceps militaris CM01]EGX90138.1 hypothetical protein CCM_06557 [Cordyceps militaris CM01]